MFDSKDFSPESGRGGGGASKGFGAGMLTVPFRGKISRFGTALRARDKILTFAYSAIPFRASSISFKRGIKSRIGSTS